MAEILVKAEGWVLQLRWVQREKVTEQASSSIRVEAWEPFTLTCPDLPQQGPDHAPFVIEASTPAPLLWEPSALEVVWEVEEAGAPLALQHPDPKMRAAVRDASGRGRVLAGTLDLRDRIGFLDLNFVRAESPIIKLRLEIFPSKMGFRTDFERMLQDLGCHRISHILRLLSTTTVGRSLRTRPNASLTERYQIFDAFFEPLLSALRQVARQPHTGLAHTQRARPVDQLRRPDAYTRRAAAQAGGPRAWVNGLDLPTRLPDGHWEATFNTPANRFVARALRSLSALLTAIRVAPDQCWKDPQLRSQIESRQRSLHGWLERDFLRELPDRMEAPDLVVQRSAGYRDVLRWYRRILLAFSIISGDVRMGIADLWYLYQIWCAVRVEQEVTQILGPGHGTLVPTTTHQVLLNGNVQFADGTVLSAQHRSVEVYGVQQPDLLLSLRRSAPRGMEALTFQMVLDAKYRLQWKDKQAHPPMDALNAIHRYRDAMLSYHASRSNRTVYGGVILFPHPDEEAYRADPTSAWQSFERMGIGAIPLVPGQGRLLREWLQGILYASMVRLDSLGPTYPSLPPRPRPGRVMVAPLRYHQAQLDQMLHENWYHLPEHFQLANQNPTHLAVYEGGWEGTQARIQWLWRIVKWQRVDGKIISKKARFGDGRAGLKEGYWMLTLAEQEKLEPAIAGYDWGPTHPMFVPLEVFDLAESVFLLRGDTRHMALLRTLHHLRHGVQHWKPGWTVREPLLFDGRHLGMLEGNATGLRWQVKDIKGEFSIDNLLHQTITEVFSVLKTALES